VDTKQFLTVVLVLSVVIGGITVTTLLMQPLLEEPTNTTSTSDTTTITFVDNNGDGIPDLLLRDQDLLQYNISVPDWEFLMVDVDNYSISDAYGQFLILEFFATWCGACEFQNSDNVEIYQAFPEDELEFLQVTTALGDTDQMLRDYIEEHGLLWDIGYANENDDASVEFFKIRYIPTLVLIDQTGILRWIHEGTWRFNEFNATIVELMG